MYTTILLFLLAGMILVLAIWVLVLEIRLGKLFRGKKAQSLESAFVQLQEEITALENNIRDVRETLEKMDLRLARKVQTVRTLRFNPFQGTGGNHSFASAFVDEHGDGVVISSLYSREKVSIFAKPVHDGKSEIELSEEESKVLAAKELR